LSASPEEANRLLPMAIRQKAPASFIRQAAAVVGARHRPAELQTLVTAISANPGGEWRSAALEGLATGLRGADTQVSDQFRQQLLALFEQRDAAVRRSALHVLQIVRLGGNAASAPVVRRAEAAPTNRGADSDLRADAVALLALSDAAGHRAMFEQLLTAVEPEVVQIAAARALGQIPGEQTGRFLLKNWRGLTTNVRMEAADALYRDPGRIPLIVSALKNGEIQPWTLASIAAS
jgi:hypothetical protein